MKADFEDISLNYGITGDPDGPALVLAHCLGSSLAVWDDLLGLLPKGLKVLRYDLRGHGGSDVTAPPYSMGTMVRDAERLLAELSIEDAVFCGIGLGGLVAQGLAVKRLDQIRALVLAGTAAKIGHGPHWDNRIALAERSGTGYLVQELVPLWFAPYAQKTDAAKQAKTVFEQTAIEGLIGGMAAMRGADFYTPTSGLRLQTLGLCGADDRFVPPDLARETTEVVPGSEFHIIRRAGHLACVDQPQVFADHLNDFLTRIAHI